MTKTRATRAVHSGFVHSSFVIPFIPSFSQMHTGGTDLSLTNVLNKWRDSWGSRRPGTPPSVDLRKGARLEFGSKTDLIRRFRHRGLNRGRQVLRRESLQF